MALSSHCYQQAQKWKEPWPKWHPPQILQSNEYQNRRQVHVYVAAFFEGKAGYNGWHTSQCVPVPKSSNLFDPNKWGGTMLMGVCSKIFSL
jgi:hypothetical protein